MGNSEVCLNARLVVCLESSHPPLGPVPSVSNDDCAPSTWAAKLMVRRHKESCMQHAVLRLMVSTEHESSGI
jgi:hypothetical protein